MFDPAWLPIEYRVRKSSHIADGEHVFDGRTIEFDRLQVVAATLTEDAAALAAAKQAPFAPIPSFWSDQYDMHILAYGLLALADEVKLIDGAIEADCVFGYYRQGKMVGVCGIGMRSVVQSFRKEFLLEA